MAEGPWRGLEENQMGLCAVCTDFDTMTHELVIDGVAVCEVCGLCASRTDLGYMQQKLMARIMAAKSQVVLIERLAGILSTHWPVT